MNRAFGVDVIESDAPNELDELLTFASPVDGIMASILTMESYDLTYGLHSHEDSNDPLSLIGMHPKENYLHNGRLQTTIRAFRTHKVGTHMHMSLQEFLALPRYVTKMILKECEEAERVEAKRASTILDNFKNGKSA